MSRPVPLPSAHEIGFKMRLAYVRWLRHAGRHLHESDRQFAEHMGVGEKWVAKWKLRDDPPDGRVEYETMRASLAASGISVDWLYDGVGCAPEPKLWNYWLTRTAPDPARDVDVSDARVARARKGAVARVDRRGKANTRAG